MTLPADVVTLIRSTALADARKSDQVVLREVVETLAGRQPDALLSAMRAAGGPPEFIQQLLEEIRRVRQFAEQ